MKDKNDGISIKDIVEGISNSTKNIYKKKITIPSLNDVRKTFIKLTGGISDENREQIHYITCLFKGQDVMPNTRFITPWLCGYVSSFSYLLFTHIGKIEEFEKKLRIMTLIYSGVFIISESEAKSLFSQVSEKVPESEEFVDGSFAAEQDFNSLIISRKETYLKNWIEYIEKGTYKPKKGRKKSIDERFKHLVLDAESTVKKIISSHIWGGDVDLSDDLSIDKKYRKVISEFIKKTYKIQLTNSDLFYTVGDIVRAVEDRVSREYRHHYIPIEWDE